MNSNKIIGVDELKKLQLEILDYVDHFCRTHNIKYSLCGGTMLGAIRHGGYIPWDDDIDIQLIRDEYDKLIDEWSKYEHPFIFHNMKYENNFGFAFGKISNPKTKMIDGGLSFMGVNIDVFPIDKVIDDMDFIKRRKSIAKLYAIEERKRRICNNSSLIQVLKKYYWKIFYSFISRDAIARRINTISIKNNTTDANYLFEMIDGRGYKTYFPKTVSEKYVDVVFESKKYMAFSEYDTYLQAIFGDYMILPPVEKRVSHHTFKAYWLEKD